MAKQRLRQIIFCSEAEGRAFMRDILITPVMGQILDNEKLPPFYEMPLEQFRAQNEFILHLSPDFQIKGDTGCPFCGNVNEFYCKCGYISCAAKGTKAHVCPKCQHIFTNLATCGARISSSGFIHGGNTLNTSPRPPQPRRVNKDTAADETFDAVRDFVRNLLPDHSSDKKALPPPKKKK
jgi:hypothetical protein